jgi:hypothetical protein
MTSQVQEPIQSEAYALNWVLELMGGVVRVATSGLSVLRSYPF